MRAHCNRTHQSQIVLALKARPEPTSLGVQWLHRSETEKIHQEMCSDHIICRHATSALDMLHMCATYATFISAMVRINSITHKDTYSLQHSYKE